MVLCGRVLPTYASACEAQGERYGSPDAAHVVIHISMLGANNALTHVGRPGSDGEGVRVKGIRSELCLERGWRRPGR